MVSQTSPFTKGVAEAPEGRGQGQGHTAGTSGTGAEVESSVSHLSGLMAEGSGCVTGAEI